MAKLMATGFDGPCASRHCFLLTTKTPQPKPLSTTNRYQPTSTATNIVVFFSMEHNSLPEVTLSALAETGRVESTIPVLMQRSYIGRNPVISSALANTPCANLGVDGVLEKLNATLGTEYNLDLPCVFGKVLNARPQRNHSRMERLMKLAHFNRTVMDAMTPNCSPELEQLNPICDVAIDVNVSFTQVKFTLDSARSVSL